MPAVLLSAPDHADVADTWRAWLWVCDLDGIGAAPDSVAVAVSLPDGTATTGDVTAQVTVGLYLITYDVAAAGDHAVEITVTDTDFGDDVITVALVATATASTWDPAEVVTYLGDTTSADATAIADALAAESMAQRHACRIPVPYPPDLAQALKRRVARNLAARAVPVASFTMFEGGGSVTRVPGRDPETARLEAPYRRLPVA